MTDHERLVVALHARLANIGVAVLIFLVGLLSYFTFEALDEAKQGRGKLADYQVVSCERGNLVRAWLVIDVGRSVTDPSERQRAALELFPLADCTDPGKLDALPLDQRNAYLGRVAGKMGLSDWRAP